MTDQVQERVSAAEFIERPESNKPVQLIDGEIVDMGSPTPEHQKIVLRSAITLTPIVETLGGQLFVAPLDVELDDENVVQPDIIVILPGGRCQIETWLKGAPDLLVEVLSPGTATIDRRKKFRLYERHGVREFWLIHPTERIVEVWALEDGRFMPLLVYGHGESFTSPLLGAIEVSKLFPA